MSIRDIANEMQLSKSKVGRIVKKLDCPTVPLSHRDEASQTRYNPLSGTGQLNSGGKVVDLFPQETEDAPKDNDNNMPF